MSTSPPRSAEGLARPVRQLVLAALAVLVCAADTYVVVLALPEMMSGVGLGLDQLQRGAPIVSTFLLGYVVVLALAGRVSDVAGRRPVILTCLGVFALGSLITASAHELAVALAGRALQGLGAGGLVPPTLALVADLWPAQRRSVPLGVVAAAQELGSVLGPLFGAVVLSLSGWRMIFWVNLALALLLGVSMAATGRAWPRPVPGDALSAGHSLSAGQAGWASEATACGLAVLAAALLALLLNAPEALVANVTAGTAFVPLLGESAWTSPLAVVVAVLIAAVATLGARQLPTGLLAGVDLAGAGLLGLALAGLVLAFADADPTRSAVADGWPWMLGASALATLALVVRQRTARDPLIPRGALRRRGAWGALAVNLLVGAALVAALVDVPVFARQTRYPDSQLGSALVLVQLLAALPVGALAGGWACRRLRPGLVGGVGMALAAGGLATMAQWDARALEGVASSVSLVAAGLGFGLAIAPVNVVLLAATDDAVHGLASAFGVLARMVGMLVGLSMLTAVGLRTFYARQAVIGSPVTLCPTTPLDCPAYVAATRDSALNELQSIFAGAAGCALAAAVLCAVLLALPVRPGRPPRGTTIGCRGRAEPS